jgi:hypothetical protein
LGFLGEGKKGSFFHGSEDASQCGGDDGIDAKERKRGLLEQLMMINKQAGRLLLLLLNTGYCLSF